MNDPYNFTNIIYHINDTDLTGIEDYTWEKIKGLDKEISAQNTKNNEVKIPIWFNNLINNSVL